jgi:WD40 repeat protein
MRVFDLATGAGLYRLAKGGKAVRDVVFAGGDRLVTADARQTIDVWDARTGKPVLEFAHGAPVEVLAASANGRWLATLEHHTHAIDRLLDRDVLRVWDLATGTRKHTLAARPKRWFLRLCFSPDGKRLLTSSYGRDRSELTVWDVETGQRVREMPDAYESTLAVSPDGTRLAAGNQLWDLKTGRRLSRADTEHAWARALAFSPAGDRVLLLGYSSLSAWETATGRLKDSFELPTPKNTPPIPTLSPDGRFALSFARKGEEFLGVIWDVAQRRRLHALKTSCWTGAFSADSSLLATWGPGEKPVIRLWDVATGREIRTFPARNVAFPFLSFTADGKTLLAAGREVAGHDVSNGKVLFSWRMKQEPTNLKSGKGMPGQPLDAYSPPAWRGFTASPDGTLIAVTLSGGYGRQPVRDRIALFDARSGKLLRRWSDSGRPSADYERLCFSHDGELLASSDGEAIHLWETATGKEIRTFRGHRGEFAFLAFSRNDRRLASASRDRTVLVWDATGSPDPLTSAASVEEAWGALGGDDAGRAHRAVWALARSPARSVPLLQARLRPVKGASRERLDRLLGDLDSDRFDVREKATAELRKLGELAAPALRRALEGKPTLEQRRRIEPLLTSLDAASPAGGELRSLRAVRVLEHAGTPEARRLLKELASGAEEARLTGRARAAWTRLNRRSP